MLRYALLLFTAAALAAPAWADDLGPILKSAHDGAPAVGAVVIRDDKIAAIGVDGARRNDRPDPVRLGDAWLIGSVAKPITAAMIARLVDRGVLSWDAPLPKLWPGLPMRPEYRRVTLRQLLSHQSGLPHDALDKDFIDGFFTRTEPLPEQRRAYVTRALADPPAIPPGSGFSYSNTGFILAAAIAEHATGLTYEALMRREVFAPLGMTSAGFGAAPDGGNSGHQGGHVATLRDGAPPMMAPAGFLHMSLGDWAAFCLDQLAGAKGHGRLLKPQTYRAMQTPMPNSDVGMDWGADPDVAGFKGPALMHTGSDGNWYTMVILFPETGNGVLVAANAGQDMGGEKADKAMLKALLPKVSEPVGR
jgi:CubicO group peptidase (beta-lactamase class C family)